MQIRIVDHGPGVPLRTTARLMFAPFQRLGDVPRDPASAWDWRSPRASPRRSDATIEVDDTPGGGLTMIVTVPVAASGPEVERVSPPEPAVGSVPAGVPIIPTTIPAQTTRPTRRTRTTTRGSA